jgi:hypothetical protein
MEIQSLMSSYLVDFISIPFLKLNYAAFDLSNGPVLDEVGYAT